MKLTLKTEKMDKSMSLALCMLAAYAALLMPTQAFALGSGGGPIGDTLCAVSGWFTGPIGQGIATLAILVIGVGALMGKVSWGMAIIVGIGVGVIFGAPTIVGMLNGGTEGC